MSRGVVLASGAEVVAPRAHIHARGDAWVISSDVAIGLDLLDTEVLDRVLPGALGRYILPSDAVLHRPAYAVTRVHDLAELIRSEKVYDAPTKTRLLNQLTVAEEEEAEEGALQDDEEVDDDEDAQDPYDDEAEEDREEEVIGEDDPKEWGSDDDEGVDQSVGAGRV
jgi:hypothetical protein